MKGIIGRMYQNLNGVRIITIKKTAGKDKNDSFFLESLISIKKKPKMAANVIMNPKPSELSKKEK